MTFWAELRSRYGRAYNEGAACFPDGKFGHGHYQQVARWRAAAATIAGLLSEYGISPGTTWGRVLDLGCGQGTLTDELRKLGVPAVGVDLGDDVRTVGAVGNGVALPFGRATISTVVALDVIEHVPVDHQSGLWAELLRVLEPGGLVVATVPVEGESRWRTESAGLFNHYCAGPVREWIALVERQGLEVVEQGSAMARRGTPFAFGDVNYPFLLRERAA